MSFKRIKSGLASIRLGSIDLKRTISSTEETGAKARERWRRWSRLINEEQRLQRRWRFHSGNMAYKVVGTESEMELVFETLDKYLVPKKTQLLNVILVGVGADEISRRGDISLVALSTLNGVTWMMDVRTLGDLFWKAVTPYFTNAMIEKAVYDCRNFADYLLNVKGIELRGMYDMMVIEARERGKIPAVKPLPIVKKTNQMDRQMFLDLKTMIDCYLGDNTLTCRNPLSPEEWANTTGGTQIHSPAATAWLCDHQVFLSRFINEKVDFRRALKTRRYIKWWVSSEYFSVLLSNKEQRRYDAAERSLVIPRYVICGSTTEQPLGTTCCYQCSRMLPAQEYTADMKLGLKPKVCTVCLQILNNVIRLIDGNVHVANTATRNLVIPQHLQKSFRASQKSKRLAKVEYTTTKNSVLDMDGETNFSSKKKTSGRKKSVGFSGSVKPESSSAH